jgi:hypothetical protein
LQLQPEQTALVAVVLVANAGLYDRPGGTLLEQLAVGLVLSTSGRSADGAWLYVRTPSGSTGWIQIADVVMSNAAALPVQDTPVGEPAPAETAPAAPTPAAPATTQEPTLPAPPTPTPDLGTNVPSGEKGGTSPVDPNLVTATVIQISSHLNVRTGPGTNYLIIGKAVSGDTFEVNGRNTAATWIQVKSILGEQGLAWVSAEFVLLSHPILGLAVMEPQSQPIPALTTTGVITCITNQIIKWDGGLATWVCSDDLIILQTEVATLQAELAELRAEIIALTR